jgi:hypothetical protein
MQKAKLTGGGEDNGALARLCRGESGSGVVAGIIRDEEGGGDVSGTDKRGTGQKRGTGGGRRLLWRPGGATERKGRGFPWSVPRGGRGAGERKGASGAAGDSSGGGARAADRRDRATMGRGGQLLGAGGSERERGSVARAPTGGPGSPVSAGRVLNPIQTESNYSKWFKRMQNCPNFGRLKKVSSSASKIENKIWLKRV